jgi:hypothetical protein
MVDIVHSKLSKVADFSFNEDRESFVVFVSTNAACGHFITPYLKCVFANAAPEGDLACLVLGNPRGDEAPRAAAGASTGGAGKSRDHFPSGSGTRKTPLEH